MGQEMYEVIDTNEHNGIVDVLLNDATERAAEYNSSIRESEGESTAGNCGPDGDMIKTQQQNDFELEGNRIKGDKKNKKFSLIFSL